MWSNAIVVAMFVVAYMGYFSTSVLFANVSHLTDEGTTFDLAAAQNAGASISLFSVFLGWFALKPLFETFGMVRVAELTGWRLIGALVVGYGLLASALYRSGYASARLTVLLPVLAITGIAGYAILIGAFAPSIRSRRST
jgi:hypothetical protein